MPDGLSGPAEIAALRSVIDQTAEDPTLIPDVNWSPALNDSWRERLVRMSETIRDQSLPAG
jgi:hypothetical protein